MRLGIMHCRMDESPQKFVRKNEKNDSAHDADSGKWPPDGADSQGSG